MFYLTRTIRIYKFSMVDVRILLRATVEGLGWMRARNGTKVIWRFHGATFGNEARFATNLSVRQIEITRCSVPVLPRLDESLNYRLNLEKEALGASHLESVLCHDPEKER